MRKKQGDLCTGKTYRIGSRVTTFGAGQHSDCVTCHQARGRRQKVFLDSFHIVVPYHADRVRHQ